MTPNCRPRKGIHFTRLRVVTAIAVILLFALPVCSWAENPFPLKIRGIKMGVPMSSVVNMIKGSGTYEASPANEKVRPALTWVLPNNPYYKKVTFRFTEKDRLFIIRFDLKRISRRDLRGIKKSLFKKYGISWDNPHKLKTKTGDALNYGPPQMGNIYFFEFTNRKTGDKAIELFDRVTSSEDRPRKKKDDKGKSVEKDIRAGKDASGKGTVSLKEVLPGVLKPDTGEKPAKPLPGTSTDSAKIGSEEEAK